MAKKKRPIEIIHFDDSHTFQAMDGDEVVACSLYLHEVSKGEDDWDPKYWLNGIETDPGYQRQGLAELLIEEAIGYLRAYLCFNGIRRRTRRKRRP